MHDDTPMATNKVANANDLSCLANAMREMSRSMSCGNALAATALKTAAMEIDVLVRDLASLRYVAQSMRDALTETSCTLMEIAPMQHDTGHTRVESALYRVHAALALSRKCDFSGHR